MSFILWHNPRCSTSRKTLALLQEQGIDPALRLYLEQAPSKAELETVARLLPGGAASLMRWKEPEAAPLKGAADADLIAAMAETPRLIERPVLLGKGTARVGRPPEAVLEIV